MIGLVVGFRYEELALLFSLLSNGGNEGLVRFVGVVCGRVVLEDSCNPAKLAAWAIVVGLNIRTCICVLCSKPAKKNT